MASKFYNRYIPPPKPYHACLESVENHDATPISAETDEGDGGSRAKSKVTKKLAKRPPPDADLDYRPKKRLSPQPKFPALTSKDVGSIQEPQLASSRNDNGLSMLTQGTGPIDVQKVTIQSALPKWIRDPVIASGVAQQPFKDFPLSKSVISNLTKEGFSRANGLQCKIFSMLLPNQLGQNQDLGDLCISAATGSGKTLAYALPMIESLKDKPKTRLRGLVVVPTREIVSQTRKTLEIIASGTGIKIGTAVGSNRLKDEQKELIQILQKWRPGSTPSRPTKKTRTEDDITDWHLDFADISDELKRPPDQEPEYASKIDILICTPGRLVDHINSTNGFHLHHIKWLIVDEADRLLDESFQEWVANVMPHLEHVAPVTTTIERPPWTLSGPRPRRIQKIILSATMTKNISKLKSLCLFRPAMVVLEGAAKVQNAEGEQSRQHNGIKLPESLFETAMAVMETDYKPLYLIQLLEEFASLEVKRVEDMIPKIYGNTSVDEKTDGSDSKSSSLSVASSFGPQKSMRQDKISIPGTLVFAKSNESALRLTRLLSILLPEDQVRALTKSPGNKEGRRTLSMFRKGQVSIIIATDLASRGLDIPQLGYVINYDMPASLTSYVHRVGRTARAGRVGRAATLVEHKEGKWFWNEIARSDGLVRLNKVTRMDGGLRSGSEERREYEFALQDLGREAARKPTGK